MRPGTEPASWRVRAVSDGSVVCVKKRDPSQGVGSEVVSPPPADGFWASEQLLLDLKEAEKRELFDECEK